MVKSLEICRLLVDFGARLNVTCSSRCITPFCRAALDNLIDICKFFAGECDVIVYSHGLLMFVLLLKQKVLTYGREMLMETLHWI